VWGGGDGVIDRDFQKEIKVILHNHTDKEVSIPQNKKIAQLIFEQAQTPCITISENLLEPMDQHDGFGSTDKGNYSNQAKHDAKSAAFKNTIEKVAAKQMPPPNNDDEEIPEYLEMASKNTPAPDEDLYLKSNNDINANDTISDSTSVQIEIHDNTSHDTPKNTSKVHVDDSLTPPILPQEKFNSFIPHQLKLSRDFIAQATGYHKSNLLIKYFDKVAKNTVTIDSIEKSEVLVDGEIATLKSNK